MSDPAYMKWEDLREMLWDRFRDDDREDDALAVTRAEACALLAWADMFNRDAQPRRDEEERTYRIISEAAALFKPTEGEAVFHIRVGGERTHIQTQAKGIGPERALTLAIDALRAEAKDAENCPYHSRDSGSDRNGEDPPQSGAECEASQSGPKGIAQSPQPPSHRS